ncbi:hypothetical protein [Anabaena sp. UHCC 0451]|uniref:hypothetical protein n=1 Tax=Anabaena sp. UHCC 0451 TaxID=2055235 RepID=UPI002B1EFB28|nr:hypothetical protein [Anabaena sp. UHCC 0451]MEA5576007.1 hypothetical protein [Anabaena sp. UHCC 0451]
MNKCQFANVITANWLLLMGINLLGGLFLSTSVAIKAASAVDKSVADTTSKELTTKQKVESTENISQKSQHSAAELKQRLIQIKQPQTIIQKIDASSNLGDTFGEAKKLYPTQPQTITQQIDDSENLGDKLGDINQLRQDLLVEPLVKITPLPKRTYQPGLSFGAPSAFGAAWGDLFIVGSGATAGKSRAGNPDASMSAGFGLGDAYNLIGLELTFNNGSIKNFGYNGTFDFKAHRVVYAKGNTQVAVAGGLNTFAQYGNEGIRPSSAYGVITTYSLLQPNNPFNPLAISFSLGAGGGDFRQGDESTGIFAGMGLQIHPQVGIGVGWSGVGLNAGISVVPVPTIPLTITAQGADLTDNSFGGSVFVLTVGYGFNFLPR